MTKSKLTQIALDCAQRLNREVNILRRLSHPNIAQFLGIAFKQEIRPCIVIKWYKNGITPKYLEINPDADRLALIKDIANGLAYLHTLDPQPIVHGDLKGVSDIAAIATLSPLHTPTRTVQHFSHRRWARCHNRLRAVPNHRGVLCSHRFHDHYFWRKHPLVCSRAAVRLDNQFERLQCSGRRRGCQKPHITI